MPNVSYKFHDDIFPLSEVTIDFLYPIFVSATSLSIRKTFSNDIMEATSENLRFYVYVETMRGQKPGDILRQLSVVFGDASPSKTFVYQWSKDFRENSRDSVRDLPHSGRPISTTTSGNISRVFDFICDQPKSSIQHVSNSLQLSATTVRRILVDELLFRMIDFVPKFDKFVALRKTGFEGTVITWECMRISGCNFYLTLPRRQSCIG